MHHREANEGPEGRGPVGACDQSRPRPAQEGLATRSRSRGAGCRLPGKRLLCREMSPVLSTWTPEPSLASPRHVVTWRRGHRARNKSHCRRPRTPPVLRCSDRIRGAWGGGGGLGVGPVGSDQALPPTSSALNPRLGSPRPSVQPPRPHAATQDEWGAGGGVDEHGESLLSEPDTPSALLFVGPVPESDWFWNVHVPSRGAC